MTPSRPEIFISATSSDLSTCRQLIKEALLTLGCTPVEQTNFPPDAGVVREMLHKRIATCHAVIHVAGEIYGAEPKQRLEEQLRCSYTQMEYEIAKKLGKPVYVFICVEGFPYDEHPPEGEEESLLQQAHRKRLLTADHLYTQIDSRDELVLRLHALQIQVDKLKKELQRAKDRQKYGLAAGALVILLLVGGLNQLNERTSQSEQDAIQIRKKLEQLRDNIKILANSYMQQQAKLNDAELFNRALTAAAEQAGVPVADFEEGINRFVAEVRANRDAELMDLALADFAERNFSSAARNAALAGAEGEAKLHAAKEVSARVKNEVEEATKKQIRESRNLEGQAHYAEKRYAEAVQAFEKALVATSRSEHPKDWAELQGKLGLAFNELANVSTGDAITLHLQHAIAAHRAALGAYTHGELSQDWAMIKHNLAITLRNQAMAAEGVKRRELLAQAVKAHRAALEVYTREALPQDRVIAQHNQAIIEHNLAITLQNKAMAAEGFERQKLQAEFEALRRATKRKFQSIRDYYRLP